MSDKEKDLTEEELAQAAGGRKLRRTTETIREGELSETEPTTEPSPTKPTPTIKGVGGLSDPTYQ